MKSLHYNIIYSAVFSILLFSVHWFQTLNLCSSPRVKGQVSQHTKEQEKL